MALEMAISREIRQFLFHQILPSFTGSFVISGVSIGSLTPTFFDITRSRQSFPSSTGFFTDIFLTDSVRHQKVVMSRCFLFFLRNFQRFLLLFFFHFAFARQDEQLMAYICAS